MIYLTFKINVNFFMSLDLSYYTVYLFSIFPVHYSLVFLGFIAKLAFSGSSEETETGSFLNMESLIQRVVN